MVWGFLNYLFSVGLAFCALAVHLSSWPKTPVLRCLLGGCVSTLLYLCHLTGFGLYVVWVFSIQVCACLAGDELPLGEPAGVTNRTQIISLIAQLVPAGILMWLSIGSGTGGALQFPTIRQRVTSIASVFRLYNLPLDATTICLALALLVIGLYTRRLRIHRAMRWALIATVFICIVMPRTILDSTFADLRMFVALGLLFVASADFDFTIGRGRIVLFLLVMVFCARQALVLKTWHTAQVAYEPYFQAMGLMGDGARIFPVFASDSGHQPPTFPFPVIYLPCAGIYLYDQYVPTLFTYATQPVRLTMTSRAIKHAAWPGYIGYNPHWDVVAANYDYVWVLQKNYFSPQLPANFTLVYHTPEMAIYATPQHR